MGRGRSTRAILATAGTLIAGVTAAGCGPESHPNDPRPPLSVEVTVNVTDRAVQVQPEKVGFSSSSLAQNDVKAAEADPKAPLSVTFTTSNTTATDTALEIHGPDGLNKRSGPIVGLGNNVYKLALPNGHYTLRAADIPGATPGSFEVGPKRVSSQQDLLLP